MTPGQLDDLAFAIDALREDEAMREAPSSVERAVMAAWDAEHPVRAGRGAGRRWHNVAAIAAAVTIVATLGRLGHELNQVLPRQQQANPVMADATSTLLVVGEPIYQGEPVRIVRMRVPATTLTSLGVRSADTGAHVDVDVIVGEDGIARAIRVGM